MRFTHWVWLGCMGWCGAILAATPNAADPETPQLAAKAPPSVQQLLRSVQLQRILAPEWERLQAVAASEPPEQASLLQLQSFYRQRGEAKRRLGRMAEALLDQRAAAWTYANEDRDARLDNLIDLAAYEARGGNLEQAIAALKEAQDGLAPGYQGYAMTIHRLQVDVYARAGDLAAAQAALTQAQEAIHRLRARRTRNRHLLPHWEASLLAAQSILWMHQGHWREAQQAGEQGVRMIDEAIAMYALDSRDWPDREAVQRRQNALLQNKTIRLIDLTQILTKQGKLLEAELLSRQALEQSLTVFHRHSIEVAMVLQAMATVVAEQGRTSEAVALAQEALHTYELGGASQDSLTLWQGRKALAVALVGDRQYEQAMTLFSQAQMREPVALSDEDLDWAVALLRTQRADRALALLQRLIERAQRFQISDAQLLQLQAFEAMALHALGRLSEAYERYAQIMPLLGEFQRMGHEDAALGRPSQQRERWRLLLEDQLALLARIAVQDRRQHPMLAEQAFALADLARGSRVQQALQANAMRVHAPRWAEGMRRVQDLQWRITAQQALLAQRLNQAEALPAAPEGELPDALVSLRAGIGALKAQHQTLLASMAPVWPSGVGPDVAPVVQLAVVRQTLRPDEVLLAWYLGEKESHVWALGHDGPLQWQRLPLTRAEVARSVAQLRRALDPQVLSAHEIPSFDLALAHRLYRQLLGPVAQALKGKRLLLAVPHAELGQLPLSLLLTRAPTPASWAWPAHQRYRSAAWLMQRMAVSQLPSVSAWLTLRQLPPAAAQRRAFAGFGDPLFNLAQWQQASRENAQEAKWPIQRVGAWSSPRRSGRRGVSAAERAQLPRLPDTREEVELVGRALGADPAQDFFLQQRASLAQALGHDWTDRRVLLFATHGLVPGELPGLQEPALALSAPEVTGEGQGDGLLTLSHVMGMRLDADWVVLSACNTAAADMAASEALSGLGRAFFYAGARALLVSSWPVDSEASRRLMTDVFTHQQGAPRLHKAQHLRTAMRHMLAQGWSRDGAGRARYALAHPLFWAPYVMVGD